MLRKIDFGPIEKITTKNMPSAKDSMVSSGHRACQGCLEVMAMGMVTKVAGPDTIVCNATGCMEIITSPYPETAWKIPWIHVAFENTSAVAAGVEAAQKVLLRKGKIKKKPNVIAFAGDGSTFDIGFQALSGALERGHNFTYCCLDNEAYMNTGVQRSSATPYGASTTTSPAGSESIGQETRKKNMPLIIAAHNIPYVATLNPAYHLDFMNKVQKALACDGPAYLHIYSVCPTGWGIKGDTGIALSKLATETNYFPLFEVVGGRFQMTKEIKKPKPILDYLKVQRRFKHLGPDQVEFIQNDVNAQYDYLQRMVAATNDAEPENDE